MDQIKIEGLDHEAYNSTEAGSLLYEGAQYIEYADFCIRLATFLYWQSDIGPKVKELADAGFFYSGFKDCVRCFFCGGCLNDWGNEDIPWVEHAQSFPNCGYTKQCKGEDFIRQFYGDGEEGEGDDDTYDEACEDKLYPLTTKDRLLTEQNAEANSTLNNPVPARDTRTLEDVLEDKRRLLNLQMCVVCIFTMLSVGCLLAMITGFR